MIFRAETPEQRTHLLAYLAEKVDELPHELVGSSPFQIFAAIRNEKLAGVVLFVNYRRQSIEFHLCGAPGWMTRRDIRYLFSYAFGLNGCLRVWCLIKRKNKQARKGAERLGFRVLGVAHDEFGEGRDGILYEMTRSQCKWIK